MTPRRTIVVGGGISGLSAAYFLSKKGVDCTLVESQPQLGGVIRTERVDECLVEAGPDSFIAQKPWAMELIRELGIQDEVIGSNDDRRKTFVVRRGKLIPLPDGIQFMAPTRIWPVITTSLLSPGAKVRMLAELFRRPAAVKHERSVAEFVKDHFGDEANEYLAQPMLAGVYGGSPETLSVDRVLPRFVELERQYGSISRAMMAARWKAARKGSKASGPLFSTLRGGMQRLTDTLAERIEGRVNRIQAEALSVRRAEGRIEVRLGGENLVADDVILAVPAHRAARMLREQDDWLATLLDAIPYNSSITSALIYRRPDFQRPLDGFGFLVPRSEKRLLAACTWVNTKFDGRAPESRALLRAFIAGDDAQGNLASDDEALRRRVEDELQELMGYRNEPSAWRISRWDRAMAQYDIRHGDVVRQIEERLAEHPGLHLTGNAYEGIGIPDCIRRSRTIAERVAG